MGNVFYQAVGDDGNEARQRSRRSSQDLNAETDRPSQNPPEHQPDRQQTQLVFTGRLDGHSAVTADWSMTHSAPDMPG